MPEVETEGAVGGAEVEEYIGVPGHGDLQCRLAEPLVDALRRSPSLKILLPVMRDKRTMKGMPRGSPALGR